MPVAKTKQKNPKIRYLEYYGLQELLDKLYADSVAGGTFTGLLPLMESRENIMLAYRNIKRNHGSQTAGVDGKTIQHIEKLSETEIIRIVQTKLQWYQPRAVKRVEIPKPDGRKRPLGIPTIWDRLIQQCILQILEPICEAKFHERSNGFRPNRSAEHAMAQCYSMMQQYHLHFVVDIDIKSFFDNVNHTKLIQQMWALGIRDKKLICILREMLKAPVVLPNGSTQYPEKGTPQGGILSPLLSNIVLNELDWWVSSQWEKMPAHNVKDSINPNGSARRSHAFRAFRNTKLKEMQIVRYADDFKIFCKKRSDAEKIYHAVKQWLWERLRLEVNEEKSSICNLKKQYSEFLGFKFKVVKRHHAWVVQSHMSEKAIKRSTEKLKEQIKRIARPKGKNDERFAIHQYNSMVRGLHEYFGIATRISADCGIMLRSIHPTLYNRLGKRLKKRGKYGKQYKDIQKRYGKSKQMRFVRERPIAPIGYPPHKRPMWLEKSINKYTPEGRQAIHKPLGLNMAVLETLRSENGFGKTIEYLDNRLSRYCGQYGKCGITGLPLELGAMHCHHVVPQSLGGSDKYGNLMWLHSEVHKLLHASKEDTICRYLESLKLTDKQMDKLNSLRRKAQMPAIAVQKQSSSNNICSKRNAYCAKGNY